MSYTAFPLGTTRHTGERAPVSGEWHAFDAMGNFLTSAPIAVGNVFPPIAGYHGRATWRLIRYV